MRPETIQETRRRWERHPGEALQRTVVEARSTEGSQALLRSGGHSWRSDLPAPLGGGAQAPSPTALLLSALAGSAVTLIRDTVAPQLGVRVTSVRAVATGDLDSRGLLAMDGADLNLRGLSLEIEIASPDGREAAQRVYEAWLRRCPVYLALVKPMRILTGFRALPAEPPSSVRRPEATT
jgi:uncharacterized OsmC-like protein